MALRTTLKVALDAQYTKSQDLDIATDPLAYAKAITLLDGIGTSQADKLFHDTRTLALSATEDLDLAGVLFDTFGAAFTLVKLKAVIVFAAAGNTNNVRVSRPATNGVPLFTAVSAGVEVQPGGLFIWIAPGAGLAVVAGTGDLVTITNSGAGTSVTYDVIIIGTSA